jgi:glycosyltransferase involved in cell wall biosynthesis
MAQKKRVQPVVSVLLVTYNHEKYIDRALASIAAQRLDVPFEVVVADDSSSDSTLEHVAAWAAETGLAVRVLPAQPRLGITKNYHRGFSLCDGRYIAVLEGDDEWIADDKLAVGVATFEEHPHVTMVANRALLYDDRTGGSSVIPLIGMDSLHTEVTNRQLAESNWFATFSACMYRAEILERLTPEIFETTSYDWMINMAVTTYGPAVLAPHVSTLYRVHEGGQWSSAKQRERDEQIRMLLPRYIELLSDSVGPELTRFMHDLDVRASTVPDLPEAEESITEDDVVDMPIPRASGDAPRVSVVMTCYNHAGWVAESINSVLDQTMSDLELIIVDDGSVDDSMRVVSRFDDPRVRVYQFAQNQGAAAALNFAVQQTRGRLVAVINSDDAWEPRKLERQLEVFAEEPELGAVFTGARFIDENSRPLPAERIPAWSSVFRQPHRTQAQWLRYFMQYGNALCHPSVLIKREFYERFGLYDNRLRQLPDFERWLTLVKHYPIRVLGGEDLVKFRLLPAEQNASSVSRPNVVRGLHEHVAIHERFFDGASNQLITEAFLDVLRHPDITWEDERLCEIAFLMWDVVCPLQEINRIYALRLLRELLGRTDTALLLRVRYGFTDLTLHHFATHEDAGIPDAAAAWLARTEELTYFKVDDQIAAQPAGALLRVVLQRARGARLSSVPHRIGHHLRAALRSNR